MKRLLLPVLIAFSFLLNTGILKAQPTLTAANTNVQVGEQFNKNSFVASVSHFATGLPAGANQSWNFANFSQVSSGPIKILFRPSVPVPLSIIQNSDATINHPDFNYYFFKLHTDSLTFTGFTDWNDFSQYYHNPIKKLQYPFTFNNSYIDNFSGHTQDMALTWPNFGNFFVKADSYGTLTLPTGLVPNVLRVKSVMVSYEIYWIDSTTTLDWYLPGVHVPILSISKQKVIYSNPSNPIFTKYQGYYINPFTLSVKENSAAEINVEIFPNPATSEVTIQYALKSASEVRLALTDALGREVMTLTKEKQPAGSKTQTLDISKLPKGVYLVRLETQEGISVKQLLIR